MSNIAWYIIIILIIILIILMSLYMYRWYLVGVYKDTIGNEPSEEINKGSIFSVLDDINKMSDEIDKKKSENETKK